MASDYRIAFVIDSLSAMGGAERVLRLTLTQFPNAPVFTLVHEPRLFAGSEISRHPVHTSFINRLPGAAANYRKYLPLLPLAVERFDLRGYDVILSYSYAVAHGVLARPEQLHISLVHAPLRYAWQSQHEFFENRRLRGPKAAAARLVFHYLRLWDYAAAQRVDHYLAVSQWVSRCVWRAYRRETELLYPPVEVERFTAHEPRENYFITVARLVAHKRLDLVVETFSRLGLPLLVVGDGPERRRLKKLAAPNVRLLGWQKDEAVARLLARAKAFVHAAEEDFGIAMVEALASGCPVIAYGKGGAREIVREGETGLFFAEQITDSLASAVQAFESRQMTFNPETLRQRAECFNTEQFLRQLLEIIEREWQRKKHD